MSCSGSSINYKCETIMVMELVYMYVYLIRDLGFIFILKEKRKEVHIFGKVTFSSFSLLKLFLFNIFNV